MSKSGSDRFLSIKDVIAETTLSCATIYRMMKRGDFPEKIQISPCRVAWAESAITAWKQSRAKGPPI